MEFPGPIAFVLGGGVRGAYQAGMIRALLDRGIRPDLILGTSAGSVNGAMLAADPAPEVVARMEAFWHAAADRRVFRRRLTRSSPEPLRKLLTEILGEGSQIEDLAIPLYACAASIERATAQIFDEGPLVPALLASCAIPGLFAPYRIGNEHYVDGALVESALIPRALSLGAKTIFVLRLDQRERALTVPRWPWQVGQLSFEISRRYHLGIELNTRREGVCVHHLPSGYRAVSNYLDAIAESGTTPDTVEIDAETPVLVTAFVGGKLDRFFDLCDQNRDDAVAETDLLALGARIGEAFGARPGSLVHQRLEQAFTGFWNRIRAAAGLEENAAKSVTRAEFRSALARLAADRAAYDEHVFPLIGSLMAAADDNGDQLLSPAEVSSLLRTLGVAEGDVHMFVLRLDTGNDGAISLDVLNEAFCDFFTSAEPGAVGNAILGGVQVG